jgi:hypothetical protein
MGRGDVFDATALRVSGALLCLDKSDQFEKPF